MLYTTLTADNNEYKLTLRTKDIIALEKLIGGNPISIFGKGDTIPTVTTMVYILHTSLQAYQHNITLNDSYDIFDKWIAEGHTITDFVYVITDIYKTSGIIQKDNEKN